MRLARVGTVGCLFFALCGSALAQSREISCYRERLLPSGHTFKYFEVFDLENGVLAFGPNKYVDSNTIEAVSKAASACPGVSTIRPKNLHP